MEYPVARDARDRSRTGNGFPDQPYVRYESATFMKTYVMTGFRIGWVVAPPALAEKYDILLQNSVTNVPTPIQEAALAALKSPHSQVDRLRDTLQHKRDLTYEILSGSRTLSVENAQATFYQYLRLPDGMDDRAVVQRLLEHGVAVVPGSAFGSAGKGHLRLTFTQEDDLLREGVARLVEVVDDAAQSGR